MEAVQQAKETRATDLGWLLDASDDAVVTLIAGETRLLAHRAVLTDRSPVFAAMFQHRMLEASSGSVSIPDVEGPVLRELLAYLYCLQAPQLPSTALQLLAAADKYGVSGLKQACEQQLAAQLSVESAAATAVLAIRHSCDGLREAAVAYIKSHLVDVMATRGWAEAVCMQPKDVVEMGLLLSEISTPAPVDSGTPATPATQPLSDHSGRRQTPASAAPPTSTTYHGIPHAEDADSRVRRPAAVYSGTSATAAPQPLSDHNGRRQTPASAAPPTATVHHGSPPDEATDSHVRRAAAVDSGAPTTLATAAPQPLSDHSIRRQTPASAAPPTAAAHHGSPHDEDADSRMSTPAPVDSGTSPTPATQPLSDPSGRCQTPASAAPPTSTTYHGSPHDEDADSCVSTPAAVDSGAPATAAPQPLSDHSGRRQTPASAAPPTDTAHHGSPHDEDVDSLVSTPAPVDSGTSATAAPQPLSDHSGRRQTPASAAPPTEAALHGSPRDEAAVSTPAAVDSGTSRTPTPQPLGDCRQTPASAALLTAATAHSSPHDEAPSSRMSTGELHSAHRPAPAASEPRPSAAAAPQSPTSDGAAAPLLWRLSPQEKGRRLIEAAWQGAVEELEALMEAGADVAAMDDLDRGTALHWAAYGGHEEAARRLLAAGAAVSARGRGRETPLHWAAMYGHAAVVRLLLAAGADHGARDAYGNTPLHLAAANGWVEAAAALLDGGADRAAKDDEGSTPLDEARRNNQQQVAKLLLADGGHTDAVLLE